MGKNFFNKYILKLLESIEQNLVSYMKVQEPESLHDLRVDIKKINAIFSFSKKIYNSKYQAILLKPLFKEAGKIREIQVNLKLLSAIPQLPERLTTRLRKNENILSQKFIKKGSQQIKVIKHFRKNIGLPKLQPSKMIIKKYLNKLKYKADIMLQNIDREYLHKYRKKIKKLIYIYNALPKRMQKKIEIDVAFINKQQQWVGDWHDTFAATNFLTLRHSTIQKSEYISNLKEIEKIQFNNLLLNLTNNR